MHVSAYCFSATTVKPALEICLVEIFPLETFGAVTGPGPVSNFGLVGPVAFCLLANKISIKAFIQTLVL
ncbi:MAG TPA: hypothetical protein DCW52_04420 [Gammaproteobacteria bacterium]|nr:hypothetical protein [Gammaproteobacteria bacterium]